MNILSASPPPGIVTESPRDVCFRSNCTKVDYIIVNNLCRVANRGGGRVKNYLTMYVIWESMIHREEFMQELHTDSKGGGAVGGGD